MYYVNESPHKCRTNLCVSPRDVDLTKYMLKLEGKNSVSNQITDSNWFYLTQITFPLLSSPCLHPFPRQHLKAQFCFKALLKRSFHHFDDLTQMVAQRLSIPHHEALEQGTQISWDSLHYVVFSAAAMYPSACISMFASLLFVHVFVCHRWAQFCLSE